MKTTNYNEAIKELARLKGLGTFRTYTIGMTRFFEVKGVSE